MIAVIFTVLLMLIFGAIGPKGWNWIRVTAVSSLIFALWVVVTVPEHFLQEHPDFQLDP